MMIVPSKTAAPIRSTAAAPASSMTKLIAMNSPIVRTIATLFQRSAHLLCRTMIER
jgi:hypothetical protein